MKIYRVGYYSDQSGCEGFTFHTSKADAKKEFAKWKNIRKNNYDLRSGIEEYETTITAKGIMSILTELASHPDNG